MRERRAGVIGARGPELAAALADQSLDFAAPSRGAIVSAFSSMSDELNTGPLLAHLHTRGFRLCLPVMQGKRLPLLFRAWSPGDPMKTVTWGIQEPQDDKPVLEPEVFLVPLLAFDRRGWRLGYGGGFFDRTLRAARASRPIVAVGLAIAEAEVDGVPHLDYDERLDWVLTPTGPLRCSD
jgi:5-formyltetrahydrofolate cyclo-ligase